MLKNSYLINLRKLRPPPPHHLGDTTLYGKRGHHQAISYTLTHCDIIRSERQGKKTDVLKYEANGHAQTSNPKQEIADTTPERTANANSCGEDLVQGERNKFTPSWNGIFRTRKVRCAFVTSHTSTPPQKYASRSNVGRHIG
jgi:hypothetical protein